MAYEVDDSDPAQQTLALLGEMREERGDFYMWSEVGVLRQIGCKVRVRYERYPTNSEDNSLPPSVVGAACLVLYPYSPATKFDPILTGKPSMHWVAFPRGGKVMVDITMPNGEEFHGVSKCHPKDNFDAKLGLRKAIVKTHWWRAL